MERTLLIKNMVCDRCKTTVLELLKTEGFKVQSVALGEVVVKDASKKDDIRLKTALQAIGFELIQEEADVLVEKMKLALIKQMDKGDADFILSKIAEDLGKHYSFLSKTFSQLEGMTLEKYLINLKIEKVKEYIQLKQLNFSEIAYSLNYKNSSHLAKQFKSITGMSMTAYKKLQESDRKGLDKIV
ncbi:MAG: helix-turn-helix transcriptional regulator [Algicola sp.]|nr:helix-turn-helix transcriptional regulator [Algicola sp.]